MRVGRIHVRFLGDDRCGSYECSLHGVWDTDMILHTGLGRQEYAQHLEDLIQSQKLASAGSVTPEQWANESVGLAEAAWVPDGTNLDEQYYRREITVVDRQMALAGLRLGGACDVEPDVEGAPEVVGRAAGWADP